MIVLKDLFFVFLFHVFQTWSDLVLMKLCQRKKYDEKKTVQIAVAWTFDLC